MRYTSKKAEQGRSMVEILAVLSIMTVLSLGAIGGYNYLNTSYQASKIKDGIMKLQTLIEARQVRTEYDVRKFLKKAAVPYVAIMEDGKYKVAQATDPTGFHKTMTITFQDVPERMYDNLKSGSGYALCNSMTDGEAQTKEPTINMFDSKYKNCVLMKDVSHGDATYTIDIVIHQSGHRF